MKYLIDEAAYQNYLIAEDTFDMEINKIVKSNLINDKYSTFTEGFENIEQMRKVNELNALNEADIEQKKSLLQRFIEMIRKIYNKFLEFTYKLFNNMKPLIDKYRDMLTSKNRPNFDVEMQDHLTGLNRIFSTQYRDFNTIKASTNNINDDKVIDNNIKTLFIPEYKDYNIDFKTFCVNYFLGGQEKRKINTSTLDMKRVCDYLYNYNNLKRIIENNSKIIENNVKIAIDEVIKNEKNNQQNQQQTSNNQTQQQPAQQQNQGQNNVNNTQQQQQNNNSNNNTQQTSASEAVIYEAEQNISIDKIAKAYQNTVTIILTSMMTASNQIFKNFAKIVKKMIDDYNGKASELKIENPQALLDRITTLEKETDQNKINSERTNIINDVKKTNPNFNGGIDELKTILTNMINNQKTQQPQQQSNPQNQGQNNGETNPAQQQNTNNGQQSQQDNNVKI